MRVAVVFPGQGTQAAGMGAPWHDHPAWKIVEQAEAALGEPIAPLLLDATTEQLARTREAQLAVLCTSLVAWEAARPMLDDVVAFAGHSLGQVTALIASGALDLEDGVRFAARRAEVTQAAADARPGRMAALLGATIEQAEAACAAAPDGAWIANDNAPGQVVIAGTPEGVELAIAGAKEAGVRRATNLSVGGAFHTPLMSSARDGLVDTLASVAFAAPSAPVVSNHDGAPYTGADTEGWRRRLAEHVTVPVRWRTSMETLAQLGAEAFVEVGHGSMIAGVAKRTVPDIRVIPFGSPADCSRLFPEEIS
ncbi:MAG TPA: ACP S-malonyltransferase [Acidimicrobiia bacterium]|nr:ACP S-malonyltransferase [Acidimicrobiia bacterium]